MLAKIAQACMFTILLTKIKKPIDGKSPDTDGENSMTKLMHMLVPLFAVFLLTACTSLVDKGNKLFESGQYSDAASFYERALAEDPDNVEAKLGLNRARFMIIDRGLIEVRLMRLSEHYTAAAEKLEQILRNQRQWNLELDSAITMTQAEETQYAIAWLLQEAAILAQDSVYPDKFRWLNYHYRQLIVNGRLQGKLQQYHETVWQNGQIKCQALVKQVEGQRFFLRDFTYQYCKAWDKQVSLHTDPYDKSRYTRLNTSPVIQIRGTSDEHRNTIVNQTEKLKDLFRQSPWFSTQGDETLQVQSSASVFYEHWAYQETRRAPYIVDKTETKRDANGQQQSQTTEVQREHSYYAIVHREQLKLSMEYTTTIQQEKITRNMAPVKNNTSEEHAENFPAANLKPTKAKLLNIREFLDQEISGLNDRYLAALDSVWQSIYCPQAANDSSGERILRCAKVNPDDIGVTHWFSQKFGLNRQQFIELYGIQ